MQRTGGMREASIALFQRESLEFLHKVGRPQSWWPFKAPIVHVGHIGGDRNYMAAGIPAVAVAFPTFF